MSKTNGKIANGKKAEESVYNALKVGMRLIDTADEMARIDALERNLRFASY